MKKFLFLLTVAAIVLLAGYWANSETNQFEKWQEDFGIKYASEAEEIFRKNIFYRNLQSIHSHNSNPHKTYEQGVNQFTGLTQLQFEQTYLTQFQMPENSVTVSLEIDEFWNEPKEIDWTTKNAVTKVKNQGQCNACYAFAAVGAVEGYQVIKGGERKDMSEQQLIDCSGGNYGNFGCIGGKVSNAFDFVKDVGLVTEAEYPYKAVTQGCTKKAPGFKIQGFRSLPEDDCAQLVYALTMNPVAVSVNAANWSSYKSGIFSNCSKSNPNFTLLLVGMTDTYWKLKNQWSTAWGENGFIRLARGETCGLCHSATVPI